MLERAENSSPKAERTDEELFRLFRAGNTSAFESLVYRYEHELYGYLVRYLHDKTRAEDVFQNTFLVVYQKAAQFEEGKPFRPWLYAIATNQAIDETRKVKRRAMVSLNQDRGKEDESEANLLNNIPGAGLSPPSQGELDEERSAVRKAVDSLPDFLRQVVLLAYFQEMKYQDIAEALGIPLGTVKSRLHTAMARLQEAWGIKNPLAGESSHG